MRISMIDRNIVSKISSNFKDCSDEDKDLIQSLDKKGNLISLLLANLEGRNGIPQDMNQASLGMRVEGETIKKFFRNAHVDSGFFKIHPNLAPWGITSHQKESFLKNSEIVAFLQDNLYQPLSLLQAKKLREEIFHFASKRNIEIGHPIVLCGLATLYGNMDAHGVLKPKKPKENDPERDARIYNALTDMLVIVSLSELMGMGGRLGPNLPIHFVTVDKPLLGLIKEFGLLNIEKSPLAMINDSVITLGFNMSLFPKLTDKDAEEFKEWFNAKKQQRSP